MIVDVCAGSKRKQVMKETWGHLAPKKGQSYKGYIIYAYGGYGDIVLLDAEFENLSDSPWLYEAMQDFISRNSKGKGLYIWKGCYSNNCFTGKLERMKFEKLKS